MLVVRALVVSVLRCNQGRGAGGSPTGKVDEPHALARATAAEQVALLQVPRHAPLPTKCHFVCAVHNLCVCSALPSCEAWGLGTSARPDCKHPTRAQVKEPHRTCCTSSAPHQRGAIRLSQPAPPSTAVGCPRPTDCSPSSRTCAMVQTVIFMIMVKGKVTFKGNGMSPRSHGRLLKCVAQATSVWQGMDVAACFPAAHTVPARGCSTRSAVWSGVSSAASREHRTLRLRQECTSQGGTPARPTS